MGFQIKETLRFRTPIPWNFPRVVPKEGLTVAGHHFPSGVCTILKIHIPSPSQWR